MKSQDLPPFLEQWAKGHDWDPQYMFEVPHPEIGGVVGYQLSDILEFCNTLSDAEAQIFYGRVSWEERRNEDGLRALFMAYQEVVKERAK